MLVCGGNLLHVKLASGLLDPKIKFRYDKCLSTKTEEDAQKSFDASTSPWFDEVSVNRHDQCAPMFLDAVSMPILRKRALDLRFLRTCRQIYDEAKNFRYTANTFSFDNWDVLGMFVKTVNWTPYIRSVRLYVCSGTNGPAFPNREMLQNVSKKLTGLRMLTFDWDQMSSLDSRKYDQRTEEGSQLSEQLLCFFAGQALKSVEVIVSDTHFCQFNTPETTQRSQDDALSQRLNRWTMEQKQEYSRFLRRDLMQHRG